MRCLRYDLFAEKIGFKLSWWVMLYMYLHNIIGLLDFFLRGCCVFYPFFYPIGAYSIVSAAPTGKDITALQAALILVLFMSGWVMTRGANMQKFFFRLDPESKSFLFGLIKQKTIPGTRILCSGWWGLSRHLNYFGEIIQGFALALPGVLMAPTVYYGAIPLLYPLYYVALFIPRQIDDDALCKKKYGAKWDEYCKAVPYRIVPGVW